MRNQLLCRMFSTKTAKPYDLFLQNQQKELKLFRGRTTGNLVHVPYQSMTRQTVKQFFEKHKIQNQKIIISVDPSHLIGIKRQTMLSHLIDEIYKGNSPPPDEFTKYNPTRPVDSEQLQFEDTTFLLTDQHFSKDVEQRMEEQKILQKIMQFYDIHPDRGVDRLFQEYKVPEQYLYIIETAYIMQNTIVFGGLNEYEFRNILSVAISLAKLKNLFIDCLAYGFAKNPKSPQSFTRYAREFIWKQFYQILGPIGIQHLLRTRRQIRNNYTFGFPFEFTQSVRKEIKMQEVEDKEIDSNKIQKNAIFEVMLGKLWSQPYTKNKFPYLTEDYHSLNKTDQQMLIDLYNGHFSKYSQVVSKYYEISSQKAKEELLRRQD